MASPDQPQAPYLNAVVAYGFRGSTRFHVPGHKAGNGADLGVRTAIGWQTLKLDIPQDIHGVDLGESPTPFERAEQLAAEAYGAARSWFLTNGATQGNHALCLALAPLGAPVVVQRNAHASVIDGLVLSRRAADVGGAAVRAGARHGARRHAGLAAPPRWRATPDARAAFIVSPTYYGMAADVEGCAEVAHAAGVPLIVDQSWGPHFGFHRELPPNALHVGADAMLTSVHKIAGSLTQSALLHVSDSRPRRPRRRRAHAAADALDLAVVAADAVAGRRAPPARAARRGAAARTRSPPRAAPPRRSIRSPAAASSATRRSAGPASPRATRCGS